MSRDTLRLYEKRGIIEPEIDPDNGYRYYDDWQVNFLWDAKCYQGMGFSLAEVQQIVQHDDLAGLSSRLDAHVKHQEAEHAYRQLALEETRRWQAELFAIGERLTTYEEVEIESCICVVEREGHTIAGGANDRAVAFANRNVALMKPYIWFPNAQDDRYFWGSAMRRSGCDQLADYPGQAGFVTFEEARALSTCVDAGSRWGFGLHLFKGLLAEVKSRGSCRPGRFMVLFLLVPTRSMAITAIFAHICQYGSEFTMPG